MRKLPYRIPTTYDGKPISAILGVKITYQTESGRHLCPQCVSDNLHYCIDKNEPEWRVVGHTFGTKECDECTYRNGVEAEYHRRRNGVA